MKRPALIGLLLALAILVAPMALLAQPAEAGSAGGSHCVYHTVQRGQTLSGIARYYGVNMWTLARQNGIHNPNRIYVGQRLLIYCRPAPPPQKPVPPIQPPPCHPLPPGHPPCPPIYPPGPPPPPPPPPCAIMPQLGFGRVWSTYPAVRHALGCPLAAEQGMNGWEQSFAGGYALADLNTRVMYLLYDNGRWTATATNFDPNAPSPWLVPPPSGHYVPRPVSASFQQFQGGTMLWSGSRGIFVLYPNGTFQRYN